MGTVYPSSDPDELFGSIVSVKNPDDDAPGKNEMSQAKSETIKNGNSKPENLKNSAAIKDDGVKNEKVKNETKKETSKNKPTKTEIFLNEISMTSQGNPSDPPPGKEYKKTSTKEMLSQVTESDRAALRAKYIYNNGNAAGSDTKKMTYMTQNSKSDGNLANNFKAAQNSLPNSNSQTFNSQPHHHQCCSGFGTGNRRFQSDACSVM